MPLCAPAGQVVNLSAGHEATVHSAAPAACSQHDTNADPLVNQAAGADETSFDLSCDGAVCHMGGGGLPSAAAPLNLPGGFSFTAPFKSRFTSPILPQPQRPPLFSISQE